MYLRMPKKRFIALALIVVSILYTGVYAADALYRFMHNDHDALVIGEIISIDENNVKVQVEKCIISAKDLNKSAVKKQLKLTEANVASSFKYGFFYDEQDSSKANPSVGDYVILSLIKSGSSFKIAWGAYKVDSLDYKNLSVVLPENASMSSKMDAAAIKAFVNSNGKITEFSFDGDTKTVRNSKWGTVIFDGNKEESKDIAPDELTDTPKDINNKKDASSVAIIGGADGPTSIYLSGDPLMALIIPAVGIFAVGFAIGYFVKGKRKRT